MFRKIINKTCFVDNMDHKIFGDKTRSTREWLKPWDNILEHVPYDTMSYNYIIITCSRREWLEHVPWKNNYIIITCSRREGLEHVPWENNYIIITCSKREGLEHVPWENNYIIIACSRREGLEHVPWENNYIIIT